MFILPRNWQLEAKKAGNNVGNYIEGHSGRLLGILFAVNRNKVQQVSLFAHRQGRKVDLNSVEFHQARKEICSYANEQVPLPAVSPRIVSYAWRCERRITMRTSIAACSFAISRSRNAIKIFSRIRRERITLIRKYLNSSSVFEINIFWRMVEWKNKYLIRMESKILFPYKLNLFRHSFFRLFFLFFFFKNISPTFRINLKVR